MGFFDKPKQAAQSKAKQVAADATHATCFSCGHTDLKVYFKKIKGGFGGEDRWICKNQKAHDKRKKAQGAEGYLKHSRRRTFGEGWWEG